MLAQSPMFELFFAMVLPLAALCCVWFAVLFFYRGLRMLVRRVRALCCGLHACGVIERRGGYVPVFCYTCSRGVEVDILGETEYETRQAAMQARRPLVFEAERPDAGVAGNVFVYVARPVLMLALVPLLCAASHYLLVLLPD